MDPSQTLADLLGSAREILAAEESSPEPPSDDTVALAERVLALHEWIERGGFLPAAWAGRRA